MSFREMVLGSVSADERSCRSIAASPEIFLANRCHTSVLLVGKGDALTKKLEAEPWAFG
jgi:hypothetical protein